MIAFRSAPREGAYVHGLLMEGARWDVNTGVIADSRLKELFPSVPVINIRVSLRTVERFFLLMHCYNFYFFPQGYYSRQARHEEHV